MVLKRPRRRRPGMAAVLLVLLLGSLGLAGGLWWSEAGPGAMRDVPDLAGVSAEQAGEQLGVLGLDSTTTSEFDDAVAQGVVVSTRPAGGDQVHKNGTVTVVVSAGPELFGVPELRSLSRQEAVAALGEAQLVEGEVTEAYDAQVAPGLVVSSDPGPGQDVRAGSAVALVLSRGPQPVGVPSLLGQDLDQARTSLEDLGLRLGGTDEQYDDAAAGTVVGQDPADGDVAPGTAVDLTVSRGPQPVAVPDVFEDRFDDAVATLEELGFVVERRGSGIFDRVVSQDPSAGTEVPPGTTVVVTTF